MFPALATIIMFAGDYAPQGWFLCQGQLLSIAQNQALFSLLGTTYGGNGTTTFALPDLRGRVPIGTGQGAGLTNRVLGEKSGQNTVTLISTNIPVHTHTSAIAIPARTDSANTEDPNNAIFATPAYNKYVSAGTAPTTTFSNASASVSPIGSNTPINIMRPYLAVQFLICNSGIYPSRN
jgi:microcystin-dependent protein